MQEEHLKAQLCIMSENHWPSRRAVEKITAAQRMRTASNRDNPLEVLRTRAGGHLTVKGAWILFDQIIVLEKKLQGYGNNFWFKGAKIGTLNDVKVHDGVYKGHPFRTYAAPTYLGGRSDHFPIYGIFTIHE